MVYHAVGLFHAHLSLPDSPVVSTPIYVLFLAYNRISHKERTHIISYVRVMHESGSRDYLYRVAIYLLHGPRYG